MGEELREGLVPHGSVVGRARGRGSRAGRGGGSLVEPTDDGTIDAASVDIVCASLSCAARVGDVRPRGADALCVAFGRGHPQDVCVVCYRLTLSSHNGHNDHGVLNLEISTLEKKSGSSDI